MFESQFLLLFLLFLIPFFFFFFSVFFFNRNNKPNKFLLPPSPPKLPIVGNLHQLGPLTHIDLQLLAQKHGPLMLIHLGRIPTLVVSSTEAAQNIMKTHDRAFSGRPRMKFANRLLYDKDIAFAPYGEYWRQMRRVVVLQLLSTTKVQSFQSVREEETALMVQKIHQLCLASSSSSRGQTGTMVNFYETLMSLTNDKICGIAFGEKYSEKEEGSGFREIIRDFVNLLGVFNVVDFIPWIGNWVNDFNGMNSKVEKTYKELDSFLEGVIQDHVERNNKKDGDAVEDFVDVLLRIQKDGSVGVPFSRDNIKAIILDMFAAGTDTTFTAIDWTMSELIRHPEIMKEVQEEIRKVTGSRPGVTEDLLHEMHYLRMVIKETLRLHPPIPLLVPRESVEDVKLQGYDISANTRVIINAWAIGRDPKSWEEPEVFNPKRFINGGSANNIDYKGNSFELIPFGAGRRSCPGIVFAMATVELTLANLLFHFDWKLPDGVNLDMSEGSGLTVHRKTHLVLLATPHFQ